MEILNFHGVETRSLIGLKSANFKISNQEDKVIFSVQGNGHGVGLSQTGADALAKQGFSYQDILKHYYTGIEIEKIIERWDVIGAQYIDNALLGELKIFTKYF